MNLDISVKQAEKHSQFLNSISGPSLNNIASFEAVNASNPQDLDDCIRRSKPNLVIHTCGPYQGQNYQVAEQCIERGVNYVDLADGRDFVCDFEKLNEKAKRANVLAICGASTVPGLSSCVVDHFLERDFSQIYKN